MKISNRTNETIEVNCLIVTDASMRKHVLKPNDDMDAGDRCVRVEISKIHCTTPPQDENKPKLGRPFKVKDIA